MIDGRLRHTLRVVNSAAAGLQTWQTIMRTSGPDAPIQLTRSGLWAARQLASTTGTVPMFEWEGPEHLDIRTRLGFLLNGTTMLGYAGPVAWALFLHGSMERRNGAWRSDLARQSLRKRLTATRPHGKWFTLAAAPISLLNGIGVYRDKARHRLSVPSDAFLLLLSPDVLGCAFPRLPVVGLARTAHISLSWRVALSIPALLVGVSLGIASLKSAFMPQAEYEERRRSWEQRMEGAT